MTIPVHRDTDSRVCGASTTVAGNTTVFANNLLVSVDSDPNSHGGGSLSATSNAVFANNKLVVHNAPDSASPDALCPIPPHFSCPILELFSCPIQIFVGALY